MKIKKFGLFGKDLTWKDMTPEERSETEISAYRDLDWVKDMNKCNCCSDCTNEKDCKCGCPDCNCEVGISESMKYHLENNTPITENIFRPGSEAFFNLIKEARELFKVGDIYTVENVSVGRCSSTIQLKEFGNKEFNTVFFERVE